jgi:hypothetical protein
VSDNTTDLAASDNFLFVLSDRTRVSIFRAGSLDLDLVNEVEVEADQIKVDATGLVFLFNSKSCLLSVHDQSDGFEKIKSKHNSS